MCCNRSALLPYGKLYNGLYLFRLMALEKPQRTSAFSFSFRFKISKRSFVFQSFISIRFYYYLAMIVLWFINSSKNSSTISIFVKINTFSNRVNWFWLNFIKLLMTEHAVIRYGLINSLRFYCNLSSWSIFTEARTTYHFRVLDCSDSCTLLLLWELLFMTKHENRIRNYIPIIR